jgi:hypothetical protein
MELAEAKDNGPIPLICDLDGQGGKDGDDKRSSPNEKRLGAGTGVVTAVGERSPNRDDDEGDQLGERAI